MTDPFWEDLAFRLLTIHLNGDALNSTIIKDMFRNKPKVLAELDFGNGITLANLD